MDKIINLINHLKAYYIILIENDLYYEIDPEKIIGKYCSLSPYTRERLNKHLDDHNYQEVTEALNTFYDAYFALDHITDLSKQLMPSELREYLKKLQAETILDNFPLQLIIDAIANDVNDLLKESFLRFGIFQINDDRYSNFFTLFDQLPNIHVNYYKSMPVPEELDVLESEIDQGIRDTESVFYLGIIDKKLGNGAGDEQGKSFIEGDLWNINQAKKYNFIGFLYTSDPVQNSPDGVKDYFIREIEKGDESFEERIIDCLLNCAYVSIFNSFTNDRISSNQNVLNIAIKNQNNIKNIISKATLEGVSILDSVKNWFDLAVQYKLEEISSHRLNYDASLSKLLNDSNLNGHDGLSIHGNDLQKINSFEIFDNNLTAKGLPILPGNIFLLNGNYFILIGQVCDVLLRKSNTRGAKVAEFLKAQKRPYLDGDSNDKFSIKIDEAGVKKIIIEHFEEFGVYYSLEVEITSKNTYYADFEVIDLCCFTIDGSAQINLEDTHSPRHQIMSKEKNDYFEKLKTDYKGIFDKKNAYKYPFELKDQYIVENNIFDESSSEINFGIKRISSLKGRFYDSLYQQYLNYKGRIDLNLIENAIFTPNNIDLTVKFSVIDQEEVFKTRIMTGKGVKSHLLKSDLLDIVSEKFIYLIDSLDDKIILPIAGKPNNKYNLSQNQGNWLLELNVLYINNKNEIRYVADTFIKYPRLFGEPNSDKSCSYVDNDEIFNLDDESKIQLVDIVRGIKLNQNSATIKFENGKITYNIEGAE